MTVEVARLPHLRDRAWIPRAAGAICLAIGILDIAAAVSPRLWRRVRLLADFLPGALSQATVAALLVVGIGFLLLAGALARRKRRAWQLAVGLLAASVLLHVLSATPHVGLAAVSLVLLAGLLTYQSEFYAEGDPYTRWSALRYLLVLLPLSLLLGTLVAYAFRGRFCQRVGPWEVLKYVAAGLVGIPTPLDQQPGVRPDVVYYSLLALGLVTFGTFLFLLLRAPRPLPLLSAQDQDRMRELLARHGERDSLGYFALRRDKSVVWSPTGKACIGYRVTSGVMLASGDPLGDPEAWPGAIQVFVEEAKRHAWIPAVAAASETGAEVWVREAGLDALEIGDEAVVEVADFSLEGRAMRNVRQMVNRVSRAGYACELRRLGDIPADELDELRRCVSAWRVGDTERGYSMALGRFGDPSDGACVVATARRDGRVHALIALVPWGRHGLSLDLMRRDQEVDPGVNELLIAKTLQHAPELGIERVSLNFAVFRAALARGERIGASPGTRAWRRVLLLASRWAQIESLYRFNAKFQPIWEPRFILYPDVGDLPR
ncbi:MAG: phosphatidylglycerol lysyltransferase domain-containing protein, partial [Actinomycetes bacterium]